MRSPVPAIAVLMFLQTVAVLGGVYYMLGVFGDELDKQLDREVSRVERQFERDLDTIRRDVRRELRRALATPTPLP